MLRKQGRQQNFGAAERLQTFNRLCNARRPVAHGGNAVQAGLFADRFRQPFAVVQQGGALRGPY